MSAVTAAATSHNGPLCTTCGTAYIGTHECKPSDLLRRAADLIDLAATAQAREDSALAKSIAHSLGTVKMEVKLSGQNIVVALRDYNKKRGRGEGDLRA